MKTLADVFSSVVAKRLVAVDLPDRGSNQHEVNGNAALRQFFGTERETRESLEFHYYRDDGEAEHETTHITFYDSRARSAERTGRTEWRLYYKGDFLSKAAPDDILVIARTKEGVLHAFIFPLQSFWATKALDLFGIGDVESEFAFLPSANLERSDLEFARRRILEDLGLEIPPDVPTPYGDRAVEILAQAGGQFPGTLAMAQAARQIVRVDLNNPDEAIVAWLDAEEKLFYAIEDLLLRDRLKRGFDSTQAFIETAQSTLQRRKSRMGLSLQHHMAAVLDGLGIRFSAQAVTERKNKPDFLFPGIAEYRDDRFPTERLTMLAAKSTCKDRWRQILTEADRIPEKHLLTLDQRLTRDQIREMNQHHVRLVLPEPLQGSYSDGNLLTLGEFIIFLRQRDPDRR